MPRHIIHEKTKQSMEILGLTLNNIYNHGGSANGSNKSNAKHW